MNDTSDRRIGRVWYRGITPALLDAASRLKPHPQNYNNGDDDELEQSVLEVGVYRPIYASTRSDFIVGGHTLFRVLTERLDQPHVPIAWAWLTEEQEKRILVADNDVAAMAWTDPGLKLGLLTDLFHSEGGLRGTGNGPADLAALQREVRTPFRPDMDDDEGEPTPLIAECPKCKHSFPLESP